MAQTLTCDRCGAAAADAMLSNLHNGDTLALCGPCLAGLFTEAAEQAADTVGVPLADLIGDPGEPPEQPAGDDADAVPLDERPARVHGKRPARPA